MYRKAFPVILVLLVSSAAAVTVNDFESYLNGEQRDVFRDSQTVTLEVNASDSASADITINDSNGSTDAEGAMTKVRDNNFQIYQKNITVLSDDPRGNWKAKANVTGASGGFTTETDVFHIAGDRPRFLDQYESPSKFQINNNVTISAEIADSGMDVNSVNFSFVNSSEVFPMKQVEHDNSYYRYQANRTVQDSGKRLYFVNVSDSGNRRSGTENFFTVYEKHEHINVTVEVAPSCGTNLDFFLVPGEGEIVQNKTGVFVEILSNSGNVESNITVEYLNVTSEGDQKWSPGDAIGNVIKSYEGEFFSNVRVRESVTYFKLFQASYPLGNYTGRSAVKTVCASEGPQNETENKDELNSSYKCGDTSSSNFTCFNETVIDTNLVTKEVTTANFTNTTSKTVSEQEPGTTAYESDITLNSTDYNVYSFNSTSTVEYDYSCASSDTSIQEDDECAFENEMIEKSLIRVQDVGVDGSNATYAQMAENEERLNTTLDCESIDSEEAECDYFFDFFEEFSFFGNFEIVEAIGDKKGGVNQSGNQTTNQTIPGNNTEPGRTNVTVPEPVPEPEPEPVPEPEPDPVVRIDIESVQEKYTTEQGQFAAANFSIENIGNVPVTNISILPQIQQVRPNWDVRNARVGNISVNETLYREVFVRPSATADPGQYLIPVLAEKEQNQLDIDYFTLEVLQAEFIPEMTIQESPDSVDIAVNQSDTLPFLIENTGNVPLENVSGRIQNIEDCGNVNSSEIESIEINESSSLQMEFDAARSTGSCNATVIVSSDGGAYAFSNIEISVVPSPGFIPPGQRVPILAILWTAVLMAYAVVTRRYDLDSLGFKAAFLLLIAGEFLILLYVTVDVSNIPAGVLLPF